MTLDELEETVNRMRKMGCIQFDGITISLQAPYGYTYGKPTPETLTEPKPVEPPKPPKQPLTIQQLRDQAGV